jgi:hypothetical protein
LAVPCGQGQAWCVLYVSYWRVMDFICAIDIRMGGDIPFHMSCLIRRASGRLLGVYKAELHAFPPYFGGG